MEKLIKLLNEYEAKRHKTSVVADIREQKEDNLSYLWMNWNYSELLCISKGYWFIERLVKNDKIYLSKSWIEELPAMYGYDYESVECKSDRLLMLLSIQENSIEFLISILKIS